MIDVCLLGTGGMMPLPHRKLSATLIRFRGETLLFDAGEGTQVNWRASTWTFNPTGLILLSHVHADHIGGLPGILFQIGYSGRTAPISIIGPKWTKDVVSALLTIVGRLPFEIRVVELDGGETFALGSDAMIETLALSHRVPCLAYSIYVPRHPKFRPARAKELAIPVKYWKALQRGESVAGISPASVTGGPRRGVRLSLVTDTRYADYIADFVRDSDLLICESMYAEDADEKRADERGHLTIRQACLIACEARVHRLWLTHFSPKVKCPNDYAEYARSIFPHAEIGRAGMKTTLSFVDSETDVSSPDL